MAEVRIFCGAGGVGKTTVSAAYAIRQAQSGKNVVLLTIDPARRLGDALGVTELSNEPTSVDLDLQQGSLKALMLDVQRTWDEVIARYAPTPELAHRIKSNRLYRKIAGRLGGSYEYMALEKLHALASSQLFDLIVIDTPPSRHLLDFLKAPLNLQKVFEPSFLGRFTPAKDSLLSQATQKIVQGLSAITGGALLDELGQFFGLFSSLADGFRTRSQAINALLSSKRTTFFIVLSCDEQATTNAIETASVLLDEQRRFAGFILNKTPLATGTTKPWPERPTAVKAKQWDAWQRFAEHCTTHHQVAIEYALAREEEIRSAGLEKPVYRVPAITQLDDKLQGLRNLSNLLPEELL